MTGVPYQVWGWGAPADEPHPADLAALAEGLHALLGFPANPPAGVGVLPQLPPDRVSPRLPPSLRPLTGDDPVDRARHGLGRSYRDVVRGLRGQLDAVPDAVLRPRNDAEVTAVLDWCSDAQIAVLPFGGGTSVVGGVEPHVGDGFRGVVSLDLDGLTGLVDLDHVSQAARLRAGTTGPAVERALRPHGLTLRFFPQSFERSTVGGWVATRAAGHFATGPTHIDDLVESVRAVTPSGLWESRRLPGSGAGPSPDRLLLGSEGILGVITEAWLRVQPRPVHRWSAVAAAPTFADGAEAVRRLLQAGHLPAACRLVDGDESRITGTLATGEAALVLGLESLGPPLSASAAAVLDIVRDTGLRVVRADPLADPTTTPVRASAERAHSDPGARWRAAFLRAPYLRDSLVRLGVLTETFETAVTWDRLPDFVTAVLEHTRAALTAVCGAGTVSVRLTHAYRDGAAPYFTVLAPARPGAELDQWAQVKEAATEAVLAGGGTVTHHHAVGRDHRRWYDAQRPAPFARALAAVKREVDPAGVLNPGVLLGP